MIAATSATPTPQVQPNRAAPPQRAGASEDGALGLLDMAVAMETLSPQDGVFEDRLKALASAHGAEMLFSLPASGLFEGARMIAALHLKQEKPGTPFFVILDEERETMRLVAPDECTADLARFAEACMALNRHL